MNHKIWAIVTARKNSKRVVNKNIVKIGGKPLIEFSFDILKKQNKIEKVLVTTDHPKIISITKKYKFELIRRPKYLSGGLVNSADVVKHAILHKSKKLQMPDWIILIQPTSIFLSSGDFKNIIKIINNKKKANSAQTVVKVPHQFHAYNQRNVDHNKSSFIFLKKRMKMHNSNTKPNFYAYGNLIATNVKSFLKNKNFFNEPSYCVEIPKIRSFDIDDMYDLKVAKQLIKKSIDHYDD